MGRTDATAEVERYIAYPGQALSYKVGQITIRRLRDRAEAALGARFDIRAFHDQVLTTGALPMEILEAKIDNWIASRSEEHKSELQSLMRNTDSVVCWKKKKHK